MKRNIFRKRFSVDCEVDRIEWLAKVFEKREENVKLNRLINNLFDRLTEQLPRSGKMQLTQFTDAMNQLICMQAAYYYANGLDDGAALTRTMSDEKLNVTLNITVV